MNIVTIWWWTWTYNLIKWLKKLKNINISAIVSMSDDWWSTWKLRDEYWILPPWDLRRAIVAMSDEDKTEILRHIFNYRFKWWILEWHNLWNLIMMALEEIAGNYHKAVNLLEELFDIEWNAYPVSLERTKLLAKLENWSYILWENNIDIPRHNWNLRIKQLYVIKEQYWKILKPIIDYLYEENNEIIIDLINKFKTDIPIENPLIKEVIEKADYIIFSPWDIYTSILPNLLIGNINNYIKSSKAKKILFMNLFTKFWETNWFKVSNFIDEFKKYIWEDIFDHVIVHDWEKNPISEEVIESYHKEKKERIINNINDKKIVKADLIKQYDMARHDPEKISKILGQIIK